MVERIEDLNLPNATVTRIIKDSLPENTNVSKETRAAIARAASVFIIYLTSTSTSLAQKQKHKTISTANVLESLRELDFSDFVKPLENHLDAFRKVSNDKKKESKAKKEAKGAAAKVNPSNSTNVAEVIDITLDGDDDDDDDVGIVGE